LKKAIIAAAAAIAMAPISVLTSNMAQAGPLCSPSMVPSIYEQCLQAEQNQATCGLASGCNPGDPCVVGSPGEKANCAATKMTGGQ
jgi:hypothetical protein